MCLCERFSLQFSWCWCVCARGGVNKIQVRTKIVLNLAALCIVFVVSLDKCLCVSAKQSSSVPMRELEREYSISNKNKFVCLSLTIAIDDDDLCPAFGSLSFCGSTNSMNERSFQWFASWYRLMKNRLFRLIVLFHFDYHSRITINSFSFAYCSECVFICSTNSFPLLKVWRVFCVFFLMHSIAVTVNSSTTLEMYVLRRKERKENKKKL